MLYFLGLFTFCRVKMTWPAAGRVLQKMPRCKEFSNNFDRKIRTFWEYFIFLCQTIQKYILVFAVNEVSELERTVNSLCYRIHYRFIILQTRLNKLIYANCYLKHVAKKKFKNHMFPYMIKPRKKSFLCRLENLWM